MKIAIDFDDTIAHGWPGKIDDPYAISVIREWMANGHECYILTGRHEEEHLKQLQDELNYFELKIPVVSSGSYDMTDKLKHQWDILIDDSDELLWEHTISKDTRHLITMHTYANADMACTNRAKDWYEVNVIVQKIIGP